MFSAIPRIRGCLVILAVLAGWLEAAPRSALAQDAQWIWSPGQTGEIPLGACYFRKTFSLDQPEAGEVQISADNAYDLYVNGRRVGDGKNWRTMDVHDITKYLVHGRNSVAVKALNTESPDAGLAARVIVKSNGGTHVAHVTDQTWKSALKEFPNWTKTNFKDSQWLPARVIGPLGEAKPWNDEVQLAGGGGASRFRTTREFRVEQVAPAGATGSLIALAFNEFGEIVASVEGGGLVLLRDADRDGNLDPPAPLCDLVKNCQGILPLNGQIFVVGAGSEGTGFYSLSDSDSDGKFDKSSLLIKFGGEMSEHGPHAPVLGPDGLIYLVLGNHTKLDTEPAAASPYRKPVEGDLFSPRYEDPRGHAAGIKAPGGTVIRTDPEGSFVETFAGGLRNAYDIAFNREGELFTFDSDMEWDLGLPWYRPTRVYHLPPGGECGWRSGWAVWPEYYFDSLPPVAEAGRGSPTGVALYDHVMFPRRFHNALFAGDWARGRILAVKTRDEGGGYTAEIETVVEGKPLNVTDLAVGPDGGLYFCTGGRGTEGGVYRIVWNGKVPPAMTNFGKGIEAALRQPQLDSAWGRQKCATIKQQLGDKWDEQLQATAANAAAKPEQRCRALDLMQLLGPFPSTELLLRLSSDSHDQVRAKAAYLLGIHADPQALPRLVRLLKDPSPRVQRIACEALVRGEYTPQSKDLLAVAGSSHRHVAFAATRLLAAQPAASYQSAVLKSDKHRLFLQGALALLASEPDRATVDQILSRSLQCMQGFVSDPDFLDLLRVIELAIVRGDLQPDELQALRLKLADEYPSQEPRMNRELIRLLARLQEQSAGERMLVQLRGDLPQEERLHLALHARYLQNWTTPQKFELLSIYESARTLPGGHSFAGYIDNVSRDFFVGLTDEERQSVLADGAKWPSSTLALLAGLPERPSDETLAQIRQLDKRLAGADSEAAKKLAIGVVAVLGRSGDETSLQFLREIYARDPSRRGYIAMALAQSPEGENWPLLVQSLSIVDGAFAQEVLKKLAAVERAPDKPEAVRQVILRGLKLGDNGGDAAIALLEKWTDQKLGDSTDTVAARLALWQDWFSTTYPNEPEPQLPQESEDAKWTQDELLSFLSSPEAAKASAERGAAVFAKAQCAKCHRHGERGESLGPDLTTVAQRFQKREILESILHPSQVISDQYASRTVQLQDGRSLTGMTVEQADGSLVVLHTDGQKSTVAKEDIETIEPSKKSSMPDGLLNTLTLEEIADLFAHLMQPPRTSVTSRRAPAKR